MQTSNHSKNKKEKEKKTRKKKEEEEEEKKIHERKFYLHFLLFYSRNAIFCDLISEGFFSPFFSIDLSNKGWFDTILSRIEWFSIIDQNVFIIP